MIKKITEQDYDKYSKLLSKQKMPKPESVLTLSWKDVMAKMLEKGMKPTKQNIIQVFNDASRHMDNEYIMGGFWEQIIVSIDDEIGTISLWCKDCGAELNPDGDSKTDKNNNLICESCGSKNITVGEE